MGDGMQWKILKAEWRLDDEDVQRLWRVTWSCSEGPYEIVNFSKFLEDHPATQTDYNTITEEQVIEWVKGNLGEQMVRNIEATVVARGSGQQVTGEGLPWES